MIKKFLCFAFLLSFMYIATNFLSTARAAEVKSAATEFDRKDYFVSRAGYLFQFSNAAETGKGSSVQFEVELRFIPIRFKLRPSVGVGITSRGAVYGGVGVFWDIKLFNSPIYLIPSLNAFVYSRGGDRSLGGLILFRESIELLYQRKNGHRLSVGLNHTSNAGIYDENPGAETIYISYQIPVQF